MTYRVEVESDVVAYLRGLTGMTRIGRLALYGFMDVLRDYGDDARRDCPREHTDSSVFRLRWTFDAGSAIRSLDLYVDDSQGPLGRLMVIFAEMLPMLHEQ